MDKKLVERVKLIDEKIRAVGANKFFVNMTYQTLNYVDNVYSFLVHYCKYDTASERLVKRSAVGGKFNSELYNRLLNLDNCVKTGNGVCKQFSQLFCLLVGNYLGKEGDTSVKFGFINTNVNYVNSQGKWFIDPHSLNFVEVDGKKYFYDIAMGIMDSVKRQNAYKEFCRVDAKKYQESLFKYDNKSTLNMQKEPIVVYVKPNGVEKIYETLTSNLYIKTTQDYSAKKDATLFKF